MGSNDSKCKNRKSREKNIKKMVAKSFDSNEPICRVKSWGKKNGIVASYTCMGEVKVQFYSFHSFYFLSRILLYFLIF